MHQRYHLHHLGEFFQGYEICHEDARLGQNGPPLLYKYPAGVVLPHSGMRKNQNQYLLEKKSYREWVGRVKKRRERQRVENLREREGESVVTWEFRVSWYCPWKVLSRHGVGRDSWSSGYYRVCREGSLHAHCAGLISMRECWAYD